MVTRKVFVCKQNRKAAEAYFLAASDHDAATKLVSYRSVTRHRSQTGQIGMLVAAC